MPLPKLEEICLRKPVHSDRSQWEIYLSPNGRLRATARRVLIKGSYVHQIRLNNRVTDTITDNHAIVHSIWSTDSRLCTYLTLYAGDWYAFTYSATTNTRIGKFNLGGIYGANFWDSISIKLLNMSPEGLIRGYAGCFPSYFTFHASKPSNVTNDPIKAFKNHPPLNIALGADGKTFAAVLDGELILSPDGHNWTSVARYDARQIGQFSKFEFVPNDTSLTMLVHRQSGLEKWTLPLDRLSSKRPIAIPYPAKRPTIL